MKKCDFEKWKSKYYYEKKVDLKKELNQKDLEILTKLEIDVKDKKYTEYEFDLLKDKFLMYDGNQEYVKNKGISLEEYDTVWENLYKVLAEVS